MEDKGPQHFVVGFVGGFLVGFGFAIIFYCL